MNKYLLIIVLAVLAFVNQANAAYYEYIDENGNVAITDNPGNIPENQRSKVRIIKEQQDVSEKSNQKNINNQYPAGNERYRSTHDRLPERSKGNANSAWSADAMRGIKEGCLHAGNSSAFCECWNQEVTSRISGPDFLELTNKMKTDESAKVRAKAFFAPIMSKCMKYNQTGNERYQSAHERSPERSKGISMHMLPMRVASLDTKMKWGFMVSHAWYLKPESERQILQTTNEFLTYVRKQDTMVQENGVWIVITNPTAYSKEELALLEDIKALCGRERIALFVARGAQLPNGWVRY